jgi:hypothetical protein
LNSCQWSELILPMTQSPIATVRRNSLGGQGLGGIGGSVTGLAVVQTISSPFTSCLERSHADTDPFHRVVSGRVNSRV